MTARQVTIVRQKMGETPKPKRIGRKATAPITGTKTPPQSKQTVQGRNSSSETDSQCSGGTLLATQPMENEETCSSMAVGSSVEQHAKPDSTSSLLSGVSDFAGQNTEKTLSLLLKNAGI